MTSAMPAGANGAPSHVARSISTTGVAMCSEESFVEGPEHERWDEKEGLDSQKI